MSKLTILYDEPHEGAWFRKRHPELQNAKEVAITVAKKWPSVQKVLAYDRPDIVLLDADKPILVVTDCHYLRIALASCSSVSRPDAVGGSGNPLWCGRTQLGCHCDLALITAVIDGSKPSGSSRRTPRASAKALAAKEWVNPRSYPGQAGPCHQ